MIFPNYGSRMSIDDIKKLTGNVVFGLNDIKTKIEKIDDEAKAAIDEAYMEIKIAAEQLRRREILASCYLEILIRCRQRIELLKVPIFVKLIERYIRANKSVVVFANFNATLNASVAAMDKLGGVFHQYDFVRGGQSSSERDEIIARFKQDEIRILFCNVAAGGESISLHDENGVYPRVSLINLTWSAMNLKQILGRIYRTNTRTPCKQRLVYVECGIEKMMASAISIKLKNIAILNDGDIQFENFMDVIDEQPPPVAVPIPAEAYDARPVQGGLNYLIDFNHPNAYADM